MRLDEFFSHLPKKNGEKGGIKLRSNFKEFGLVFFTQVTEDWYELPEVTKNDTRRATGVLFAGGLGGSSCSGDVETEQDFTQIYSSEKSYFTHI